MSKYKAGSGVAQEIENPKLVYETEAFLFQVKSCLDVLIQALTEVIQKLKPIDSLRKKKGKAGGEIINALNKNGFPKLASLFEKNCIEWIQDLTEMRDQITHHGNLHGFNCFIEEPYKGSEKVVIHYPTMPSKIKVDEYCQDIYDKLLILYETALSMIEI